MTRSGAFAVAVLALTVVATTFAPAGATPDGSGQLHGARLFVGIESTHDGHDGQVGEVGQVDSSSPSLPALVHYIASPLAPGRALGLDGPLCNAGTPPAAVFGWLYDVIGYSNDGRVVSDTHECVAFPDQNGRTGLPAAPALPVAPTVGDVWRAVTLPAPVIGVNPVSRGVTGLDSWLWSGGPQTAQIAVTLDGLRVVGVARLVEYRFFTDEGYIGASPTPGDAANPAAKHRFATKGAHLLGVSSVWRANVTVIGTDGAEPVDIETAVLTATVDYPVTEVRARLVG